MHDDGKKKKPRQNNEIKKPKHMHRKHSMFENRYNNISTMFFHSDSHRFMIFMRSRYVTKVLSVA